MGASHVCIQRFSVLPNLIGEIPSLLLRLIHFIAATAELHSETAGGLDAGVGQHADEDDLFDSVLF
jgi:hypothetical protein